MDLQEFKFNIPDIVDLILAERDKESSVNRSNVGGFQGFFYNDIPNWIQPIIHQINKLLPEYKIEDAWFNVTGPGAFNRWHRHRRLDNAKVLVVYVQVPDNSGMIEFQQGRKFVKIMPKSGTGIVFAGDLLHQVLTNKSSDYRISIAFNLIKE